MAQKIQAIQALEAQGVEVRVMAIPLTNENAVQDGLQEIKRAMGPIGGIIHCAGLVDSENPAFIRKSIDGIRQVFDPKVAGLNTIVNHFKDEPLQFFVLFSSVSAIIPTLAVGLSDYAMANAYMDYVAEAEMHSCPIVSIQWPNWEETGLGEVKRRAYKQTGLLSHSNTEGLQLLDHILSKKPGPVVLPAMVDSDIWKPDQLMKRTLQEVSVKGEKSRRLKSAGSLKVSDVLLKATQKWLITLFSEELKIDPSKLAIDTPFQEYGVDSILLAQLLRQINQLISDDLDPSIIYEYSTIEAFALWLANTYDSSLSHALQETISKTI